MNIYTYIMYLYAFGIPDKIMIGVVVVCVMCCNQIDKNYFETIR